MCDRPRLLNPVHHHPTILPFPQQLVSDIMSDRLTIISRPGGFLRLSIIGRYCWLTRPYLILGEAKRRESTRHDMKILSAVDRSNQVTEVEGLISNPPFIVLYPSLCSRTLR